ncbi:hypothetical protein [Nonomuraea typhae]|uniref:hypothetical protein n=1 Tax=Nonomuraea typhae TaxID=2603600 RepID=UPI0012FC1D3C|nr:hypothetical protein [Nonomuraea typhae]
MSSNPDKTSVIWSPDIDRYARGDMPVEQVRCALCRLAPCECPAFGSDAYFALLDRRHARGERS